MSALLSDVLAVAGDKGNALGPLLYLSFSLNMENRPWCVCFSIAWHTAHRAGLVASGHSYEPKSLPLPCDQALNLLLSISLAVGLLSPKTPPEIRGVYI